VRLPIQEKNGRISYKSGTSFAAPYYTALIAAILSQKPQLQTVSELVPALTRGVVDLGEPGRDPVYGWGLVKCTAGCDLPHLSQF
jgi:subtilisin family serine protease